MTEINNDRNPNDYISIAKRDYDWVNWLMVRADEIKEYNQVLVQLQQVAEKYLKGVIDATLNINGKYDRELRTHNLRLLAGIVNENCNTNINIRDSKFLGDFYFDARYPGDNYEIVRDRFVAIDCKTICNNIINEIDSYLNQRETSNTNFFGSLE